MENNIKCIEIYLSLPAGIMQGCYSILICSIDAGLMFFDQVGNNVQVSFPGLSKNANRHIINLN